MTDLNRRVAQLASSVSHFANGSNFEPVDYSDLEVFRGARQPEKAERMPLIFEHGKPVATMPMNPFKPDFSMTNAGLHIQLPLDPLPDICQEGKDVSYADGLRLAFLACKLKQRDDGFVAIHLRKCPNSNYWRVAFNGCTVHHVSQNFYKLHHLPITTFNPIWVSKAPSDNQLETNRSNRSNPRLPLSVKRIRFELWYKGPAPMANICCSSRPEISPQHAPMDYASEILYDLGEQVPRAFRESKEPLQHYLQGSLPTNMLSYEIAILHKQPRKTSAPDPTCIAFGVIDGHVWMMKPWSMFVKEGKCFTNPRDFLFPYGEAWSNPCNARRYPYPVICIGHNQTGTFSTAQLKDTDGEYVTQMNGTEELSLRIYLFSASQKGWSSKLWTSQS
jgi:hypothetical protein